MADPLDILTGTVRRDSGDGFNNTLANIAQVIASIPERRRQREAQQADQEYRQARVMTQQQELGLKQQEFTAKQRAAEMGAAANAIVQGAMVQKEDGSWVVDRSRVQKGFGASQVPPEMQLKTLKALDDIDESLSKFATVKREHTAGVLNGVIKAIDDGIDPDMALTTGIAVGKKNSLISDDDLQGLEGLLSGGDVRKKLALMRDTLTDKYADKEETLAPGAMRVRGGHVIAQNTKSANPTEASIALAAAGDDPAKALELMHQGGSGAELDARYQALQTRAAKGEPLTPDERAEIKAYERRKTLVPGAVFSMQAPQREAGRSDRSYTLQSTRIQKAREPLQAQAERMDRLIASVNAKTPTADALIAPELLTVMAGGQGSGLRMNEAEIARIVGGRTKWESMKAALNKWSLDPSKGLSVTDAQRGDIQKLILEVRNRSRARLSGLDEAASKLIDSDSVDEQRRITEDALKGLGDTGGTPKRTTNPYPPK